MDRWQQDMDRWDKERRLAGDRAAQAQINEEAAQRARESDKGASWLGTALFIVGLIYFQTIAEYCIQAYSDIAGLVRSVEAWFGF